MPASRSRVPVVSTVGQWFLPLQIVDSKPSINGMAGRSRGGLRTAPP
ncbi:hypothetical protein [Streptomyces sp. MH13]